MAYYNPDIVRLYAPVYKANFHRFWSLLCRKFTKHLSSLQGKHQPQAGSFQMWWMMSALHQKRPHRNLEQIVGLDWKMGSSRSISIWLAVKTKSLLSRIYHFQCIWIATHFETQTCSSGGPHLGNTFWGKALSRTGWPRKQYHYTTCLFLHDFGWYSMSLTPFRTPANVADWKRRHFWINTSSDLGLPLRSTNQTHKKRTSFH